MNDEGFLFPKALRFIFVGKAIIDLSCEHAERYISSVIIRAVGTESEESAPLNVVRERLKTALIEAGSSIFKRAEVLQQEFKDNLHKQVADMSLEMLGDSSEINELRAEIAGLRAELVQLRAQAKGNSKLTV